jgi:hypothetical protein
LRPYRGRHDGRPDPTSLRRHRGLIVELSKEDLQTIKVAMWLRVEYLVERCKDDQTEEGKAFWPKERDEAVRVYNKLMGN